MQNDIDLSTKSLLAQRTLAEKAKYVLEQIARLQYREANPPKVVIAYIDEIIHLRAKVESLNREADWLADHCREFCESYGYCGECPMFSGWLKRDHEDCGETVGYRGDKHTANWREAAREAVEKQCQK